MSDLARDALLTRAELYRNHLLKSADRERAIGKLRHDLPLEAATQDVIARYKRGNDMLTSAAIALRKLKERVDAGEAGCEWNEYRGLHLEPHISRQWLNTQLRLAPPGATEEQVARNAAIHRERAAADVRAHRERQREAAPNGTYVSSTPDAGELFLDSADDNTDDNDERYPELGGSHPTDERYSWPCIPENLREVRLTKDQQRTLEAVERYFTDQRSQRILVTFQEGIWEWMLPTYSAPTRSRRTPRSRD
jgi:hypothetical protein